MNFKLIYIVAPYIGNINISKSNRFLSIASILNSAGYEVILITSKFCHNNKKYFKDSDFADFPYQVIKISALPYFSNISGLRIISNITFGINLFFFFLFNKKKNCLFISAFPFVEATIPIVLLKSKNDILLIDLQDLWPESFSLSRNFQKLFPINLFLTNIYLFLNKFIFMNSDILLSVSHNFVEHAIKHYNFKKFNASYVLYLGSISPFKFEKKIIYNRLSKWNLKNFYIGYIGNVSKSYDLSEAIKFISYYNKKNKTSIGLKVVGYGDEVEKIKKLAFELSVKLIITGSLRYDVAMFQLSSCLIAINPINRKSVSTIINKHSDYAFLAMPVLNSHKSDEYIQMLKKYKCGLNYDSNSYKSFEKAINKFIKNKDFLISASFGSRRMWNENFNRRKFYPKILNQIIKK